MWAGDREQGPYDVREASCLKSQVRFFTRWARKIRKCLGVLDYRCGLPLAQAHFLDLFLGRAAKLARAYAVLHSCFGLLSHAHSVLAVRAGCYACLPSNP